MSIEGDPLHLEGLRQKLYNPGEIGCGTMEYFSHRLGGLEVHFTKISDIRGPGYFWGWEEVSSGKSRVCC